MASKRALIIVLLVFVGIGGLTFLYYRLGGFSAPQLTTYRTEARVLAGVYYEGRVRARALNDIFERADSLVAAGALRGTSAALYYNEANQPGDTARAFVGVLTADRSQPLPSGYAYRAVPAGRYLRAELRGSLLVAPRIYEQMADFTTGTALTLTDTTLEQYPSPDSVVVETLLAGGDN